MPLAQIQYPSPTGGGLEEWAWHNFQHHEALIQAVLKVKNIKLTAYRIWPFPKDMNSDWLEQHQQAHDDLDAALGLNGSDLSSVDYKDKRQLDAWLYQHFVSHQSAASALGLPNL